MDKSGRHIEQLKAHVVITSRNELPLPQASLLDSIEGDLLAGVSTAAVSPVASSESSESSELPVQPDHVEEPVHETTTQPEGQVLPPPTLLTTTAKLIPYFSRATAKIWSNITRQAYLLQQSWSQTSVD